MSVRASPHSVLVDDSLDVRVVELERHVVIPWDKLVLP